MLKPDVWVGKRAPQVGCNRCFPYRTMRPIHFTKKALASMVYNLKVFALDQGYGRGDANTPPFFTTELETAARGTLYLTDENTLRDILGAAWLTMALQIHVAMLV